MNMKVLNKLLGKGDEKIVRYFPIRRLEPKATTRLRKQLDGMTKKGKEHALLVGIDVGHGDAGSIVQAEIVGKLL